MEERIQNLLKERFGRDIDNCTKSEIFEVLMVLTKQEMASAGEMKERKTVLHFRRVPDRKAAVQQPDQSRHVR